MTLKRHVKQPDKKLTVTRPDPRLSADVVTARGEYTAADGGRAEHATVAGIDASVVASDERAPVVASPAVSATVSDRVLAAASEYTPAAAPVAATAQQVADIAADTENVVHSAVAIQVGQDVQSSPDTATVVAAPVPVMAPDSVQSSPDTEHTARSTTPVQVRGDVVQAQDDARVGRIGAPTAIATDVSTSDDIQRTARVAALATVPASVHTARDAITVAALSAIPAVGDAVPAASDTDRTLRITHTLDTRVEVAQARDTATLTAVRPPAQIGVDVHAARDALTPLPMPAPPIVSPDIVAAPDAAITWKSFEDDFAGAWLPKGDPVRIGKNNYATVTNFRYTDFGFEGVGGHTRINPNPTGRTLTNGIQLRTNYTQESYVLVQGTYGVGYAPLIIGNTADVPDTGNCGVYEWIVDNTNNTLYAGSFFAGGYVTSYVSADQGTYASGTALASHLTTKMNADTVLTHSGSLTFTVTYNSTTYIFTITTAGGTCKVFGAQTACTIGSTIGFTTDTSYSATLTGSAVANDDPVYVEDNNAQNTARFSLLPRGHVGICNQNENLIWAGDEMPCAAFLLCSMAEDNGTSYSDFLALLKPVWVEDATKRINSSASTDTVSIASTDRSFGASGSQFDITHYEDENKVRYAWDGTGTDPNFLTNGLRVGDVVDITAASFASGNKGLWKTITVTDDYIEVYRTDADTGGTETNKQLGSADFACYGRAFLVGSTRPIQSAKFYIDTANTSSAGTSIQVFGWDGDSFTLYDSITDGTESGGKTLVTDEGEIAFSSSTFTDVPVYVAGYYLYFYLFQPYNCNAVLDRVTVNAAMTDTVDLWDGSLRPCLRCKVRIVGNPTTTEETDYTLESNTESYVDSSYQQYAVDVSSMDRQGSVTLLFAERMSALSLKIIDGNTSDAGAIYARIQYSDGKVWRDTTVLSDTTSRYSGFDDYRDTPLRQTLFRTGVISWEVPDDEERIYMDGLLGYAYRLKITDASGAKLSSSVKIDLIHGIVAHGLLGPTYMFPFQYKNRAMWCACVSDKEYNRVDYSASNAPDVYNGEDASGRNSERSLWFGNSKPITAAIEVYGRYGDTADTLGLVFKDNETYILSGDGPATFRIFKLSGVVGCPAPLSIAQFDMAANDAAALTVVMWISDKGPMMFVGASMYYVPGLELYFDPADANYIGASYIKEARGWYDHTYREYNVIIPTGTGNTDKLWLVYDVVRRKWRRTTPTLDFPSGAFNVEDSNGNKYCYGYTSTGYLMRLDHGLYWAGSTSYKISNTFKSADMILSGSLWHESTVRQIRLLHEHNAAGVVTVRHYADGNTVATAGIVSSGGSYYGCAVTHTSGSAFASDYAYWDGGTNPAVALTYAASGPAWAASTRYHAMPAEVTMAEASSYRYKRYQYNLSITAFSHSFEIIVNGCTAYKPKLLGWGLYYDTADDLGGRSS